MPKISVILPVYNASEYLREAIDSIVKQTYEDWELLIINDGSSDNSKSIIESYLSDHRIKYFENERNIGLIKTLNKGIALSQGLYIARMDADDISMEERFEKQLKFLEENNEYVLCGSNATVIDKNREETGKILNLPTNEYLQINLLFSVPFVHPSVMIRGDVLKENLFHKDFKHAEDYELWCRIADKYKVANLSAFLLKYRWHNTNISVLNNEAQDNIKEKIIRQQLFKIGLNPSSEELVLHKISFQQYDSKNSIEKGIFGDYKELDKWLSKIIIANRQYRKYQPDALTAYLWSRWIVLCISQKRFFKVFKPRFVSLNFNVIKRTLLLLYFFSKK